MQTLQELVDTAIQSESPHQPQLVISPSWLTGAGSNPEEVWRALLTLGNVPSQAAALRNANDMCSYQWMFNLNCVLRVYIWII